MQNLLHKARYGQLIFHYTITKYKGFPSKKCAVKSFEDTEPPNPLEKADTVERQIQP